MRIPEFRRFYKEKVNLQKAQLKNLQFFILLIGKLK